MIGVIGMFVSQLLGDLVYETEQHTFNNLNATLIHLITQYLINRNLSWHMSATDMKTPFKNKADIHKISTYICGPAAWHPNW